MDVDTSGTRGRSVRTAGALLVAATALAVGVAACGGDDETSSPTTEQTTTDESTAAGREVFLANCGTCHTLSDAGTSGAIGPELDGGAYAVDQVEAQVRSGGGAMPAFEDTLSDEEIQEVSAYVSAASGG